MMSGSHAKIAATCLQGHSGIGRHRWILLLVFSALLGASTAVPLKAQSYLQNIGVPPFTTTIPVENGFINAANGNLHLEIPLGSFPQRGGRAVTAVLMYDSTIWYPLFDVTLQWSPTNTSTPIFNAPSYAAGWRPVTSVDPGIFHLGVLESGYCAYSDDYTYTTYSPWIYSGPDGTQHSFAVTTEEPNYPGHCGNTGFPNASGYASDGSGYYISITNYTNATVYAPDGTSMVPPSNGTWGPIKDSNGNLYSQTGNGLPAGWKYNDTLNRTFVLETNNANGNPVNYNVENAEGGTSTFTVKLGTINVNTSFGQSGVLEYSGAITAVNEIDLPDNTKYTFTYDSGTTGGHYGLLTSMTLPTGGQITYSFANFADAYGNKSRWITHRTTPDSSTGWSYGGPSVVGSGCTAGQVDCQQTVTATKPNGDYTIYTFTLNGGAWPTQIRSYGSSANLLATTTACYSFVTLTNAQCSYSVTTAAPATNVHKTAATTTLPIPSGNVSTTAQFTWDTYGNLTKLQEWNFGSSTSGNADRTTNIAYLGGTSYIASNILNRPTTTTVTDSGGNFVAQTVNCYDYAGGCGGSSFASATGKTQHDDTNYGTSNTVRGDLTQVKRYFTASSYLTTSMTYDMTGQVISSTDSNNNITSYDYTDHFYDDNNSNPPATHSGSPATNAYVTTITPPAGSSLATTLGYYFGTGQLAKATDPNGNTSYSHFYDLMNWPTGTAVLDSSSVTRAWTLAQYDLSTATPPLNTGTESFIGIGGTSSPSCTQCRHDQLVFDTLGLGRFAKSYLVNDPDGETEVDTQYDINGRVKTVSNPYRSLSDPTYGLETPTYDGLDRASNVTHADSNVAYSYYGAAITSTLGQTAQQCSSSTYGTGYPALLIDEVGNKRETWTNGFGRLIEADEPDSAGALNKKTCYSYDMNNNLTGVLAADGSQTRSFSYDKLSRLTSKTEPEPEPSASSSFYYTTSGGALCSGDPSAICRRTDGRGITTTYAYDSMNRLTGKSYTDSTPVVTYSYDQASYNGLTITNGKGHRTGMSDGSGQTAWSYDPVGNALTVSKTINGQTKTMNYTYNLDGSVLTIQYPGLRTLTYATSNAQRQTSAKDNSNSINYALSATYAPQGALASIQDGSSLISTFFYNNRLELCRISVKNTGTATTTCANTTYGNVLDLTFSYGQSSYYGSGSSFNNGNIASVTNNLTSGRTWTYTYDPLNRLLTAQSSASSGGDCSGQGFGTYNATLPTLPLADDVLNNQLLATSLKCSSPAPNWSVNSHNEITNTGFTYGNSGDTTADSNYTYTYDAEDRLTAVVTGSGTYCYKYDGNGLRVQKGTGSSGSCSAPIVNRLYWRDTGGNTIAETDGTGSTTNSSYNEYVGFAGQRIAQSNPSSGNVYYYFSDHLGSTRVVTNATGSPCYEADFLPYGAENTPASFTDTCSINYKFTGYERDPETNNDYAFARYYSPRLERFLSPDPMSGDISDPQTLNKYTYVRNNPVNFTDPSGLTCEVDCGGGGGDPAPCSLFFDCGGSWPGGGGSLDPLPPPYSPPDAGTNPNPPSGEGASGDPLSFGCESLGMPCGMQFPSRGGGLSGCTYGSGSCGGMIYGYQNPGLVPVLAGGGGGCVVLEPCGASVGIGALITMTALAIADMIHTVYESRKQTGPPPAHAPTPPQNPADSPGAGWEWRGPGPPGSGEGAWYNPGLDQSLRPNLTHPGPIGPHWDWKDSDGKTWRLKPS
jgi:RHS repeat-associated protein